MANNLQGFLQVYAQESLKQLITYAPLLSDFTTDFSSDVAQGGSTVTTRYNSTSYGAANDLTAGYASSDYTSSAVTMTLGLKNFDHKFNELEWQNVTGNVLKNSIFPSLVSSLANSIVVAAINTITSSVSTNTVTVASSSLLTALGATGSLAQASQKLTENECPQNTRFAYINPAAWTGVMGGIAQSYVYGNTEIIQNYRGLPVLDFKGVYQFPRFTNSTHAVKYGNSDKLIGFAAEKSAICVAMRAPVDINNGIVESATATDPASGISVQLRLVYDVSNASYRILAVASYGVARGNPLAVVPILSTSGV